MRRLTDVDRRGVSSTAARKALRAVSIAALACLVSLAAAPRLLACTGDCDGDDAIAIQELIRGVDIALGTMDLKQCPEFDSSGDNQVTVDELISAVDAALNGCPVAKITTIVGNGVAGLNEDGLPPLQTYLYLPQDVTIGPDGNLYFADWNNHRIRRIKDGVVETVAGTGDLGAADDGPSLETDFNHPTNVYFDHEGRMVVAAWHNSKVKRVDFATGLIENLAGTGARAADNREGVQGNDSVLDLPSSVVVDSNDNIIISDQANYRLRFLEPSGLISTNCNKTGTPGYSGDGGPARDAQLDSPKGQSAAPAGRIDIDPRNRIYIADTGNHCIRMIDEVGTITTIAGTGEAGYSGDGGPATQAQLNTPSDVAVAPNGTIYIADTMNNVVRHIKLDGTIETVAGTGERGFSGDGGPAVDAMLDRPYGLTVGPNGNVYVCDTHNQRIRKITGADAEIPPTPLPSPTPVIIPCSNEVGTVCTYAGTGQTGFNGDGIDRLQTVLYWPFDIEFTPSGRQIVLDWNNHRVREILPDGTLTTVIGTDFIGDGPLDLSDLTPEGADPLTVNLNHPTDLKEFPNGDLMLMAWHNHKIRELDQEHQPGARASAARRRLQGRRRTGQGRADEPAAARRARRATAISSSSTSATSASASSTTSTRTAATASSRPSSAPATQGFNGDGVALQTQLNFPAGGNPEPSGGMAIDGDGTLCFSDTKNNRIRKVDLHHRRTSSQGTVTTIAGTGDAGFSGDGGPADGGADQLSRRTSRSARTGACSSPTPTTTACA